MLISWSHSRAGQFLSHLGSHQASQRYDNVGKLTLQVTENYSGREIRPQQRHTRPQPLSDCGQCAARQPCHIPTVWWQSSSGCEEACIALWLYIHIYILSLYAVIVVSHCQQMPLVAQSYTWQTTRWSATPLRLRIARIPALGQHQAVLLDLGRSFLTGRNYFSYFQQRFWPQRDWFCQDGFGTSPGAAFNTQSEWSYYVEGEGVYTPRSEDLKSPGQWSNFGWETGALYVLFVQNFLFTHKS
jgi:hypothetical protein